MTIATPILAALSRAELERMALAGRHVLDCRRRLAALDTTVLAEVVQGPAAAAPYIHYPPGDVYDRYTHAQYYYHHHRASGEAGHFHTFLRPAGMPPDVSPTLLPQAEDEADAPAHLIAISIDESGRPFRLFTTNRWVTGETWYPAADVVTMLPCFAIDEDRPSPLVNRWVTNMVRLFRPQIESLLIERDDFIEGWPVGAVAVHDDRDLEVPSAADIDVDAQVAMVAEALASAAPD